jgi:hypothetical protein
MFLLFQTIRLQTPFHINPQERSHPIESSIRPQLFHFCGDNPHLIQGFRSQKSAGVIV